MPMSEQSRRSAGAALIRAFKASEKQRALKVFGKGTLTVDQYSRAVYNVPCVFPYCQRNAKHLCACDYAIGYTPPRYPVPAIRYEVELFPDRVMLWRKLKDNWSYRYLARKPEPRWFNLQTRSHHT